MIPADVTGPRSTPPPAGVCSECGQRGESCDCSAAADGGLLAESRRSRSFAAKEKAVALVRHARECTIWRLFVDGDEWGVVLTMLRDCAASLGDDDAITARQQCSRLDAQRACVSAFAAVADARKEGR